jgi:Zn-dependent peptidase ImmA (M78 family)/DNA-binding XRE family transcriptional regulator
MNRVGELIQTARLAKGMTQGDLAEAAGVTQAALSRYEHDLREPEPGVLRAIATALGVTSELLAAGGRIESDVAGAAHMRRQASAKVSVWRRLEAQLNMVRFHATGLLSELAVKQQLVIPRLSPEEFQPTEAAQYVRAQWRMPSGPVHSIVAWLEAAGTLIVERDFGPGARVDGLSQWADPTTPVMLISQVAPTDRKRLTYAHELGHLVLHSEWLPRQKDVEQQATDFAAEFLMPACEIKPMLRGLRFGKLADLKRYWGTSMAAIIERARQLDIITPQQRITMYKELSARRWRTREPLSDELTPEVPTLGAHIGASLRRIGLGDNEIAQMAGFASAGDNDIFAGSQGRTLRLV